MTVTFAPFCKQVPGSLYELNFLNSKYQISQKKKRKILKNEYQINIKTNVRRDKEEEEDGE